MARITKGSAANAITRRNLAHSRGPNGRFSGSASTRLATQTGRTQPKEISSALNKVHGVDEIDNLVSIDLGTSTSSACLYQLLSDRIVEPSGIVRITFTQDTNQEHIEPMKAAWHNNQWYIGRELDFNQDVPREKIISNFKLLLYDPYDHTRQVQEVKRLLEEAGKTKEQLMEAVLSHLWTDVRKYMEDELSTQNAAFNLDKTRVYIAVPKMATMSTNKWLLNRAEAIGLPKVRFVHEPMCAGACVIEEMRHRSTWKERLPQYHGKTALVLDCGGGTTDAAMIELSVHGRVQVKDDPDGGLFGSSSIDESFRTWLEHTWYRSEPNGMRSVAARLGLGTNTGSIYDEATEQFVRYKLAFPAIAREKLIHIRGKNGASEDILLTSATIKRFFDEQIDGIIDIAERNIARHPNTKLILLSGGLGASFYLQERLTKRFRPRGIYIERPSSDWRQCPVARGALLVDHVLDQAQQRAQYAIGLVNDNEPFNPQLHPDAVKKPDLVVPDYWQSKQRRKTYHVVEDRIIWLMDQNTPASVQGNFTSAPAASTAQMFQFRASETHLSYRLVFTTESGLRDHVPLHGTNGEVDPRYDCEEGTFRLSEEFINMLNQKTIMLSPKDDDGNVLPKCPHFQFWGKFAIRHDNKSIDVGLRVIPPELVSYNDDDTLKEDMDLDTFSESDWIPIWNADFDARVLDTSAPVTSHTSQRAIDVQRAQAGPSSRPMRSTESDRNGLQQIAIRATLDAELGRTGRSESATVAPQTRRASSSSDLPGPSARSASGKRKKGKERARPASKSARTGPAPISTTDLNARSGGMYYERGQFFDIYDVDEDS